MGDVVTLQPGGAARASGPAQQTAASVIMLPAVRTEATRDHWQDMPSDSAPPYLAPDSDMA